MNRLSALALTLVTAALTSGATIVTQGGTIVSGQGQVSSVANTTTIDFNNGTAPSSGAIVYTLPAGSLNGTAGSVVQGSLASVYASPVNNTTPFLAIGLTGNRNPVTISFGQLVDYFGFYASSLDWYNTVSFLLGGNTVLTLTGTQIATLGGFAPDGNQNTGLYVNIFAGVNQAFDQVILSSAGDSFETDNHAFRALRQASAADVPEPESIAMVGGAAVFLAIRLRRR